jgi:ATP-dependent DNA ligase
MVVGPGLLGVVLTPRSTPAVPFRSDSTRAEVLAYVWGRLSSPRIFPISFIAPCLPVKATQPPSGDIWLHEIKLDGFRVIARKDGDRVQLYRRPGNDLTKRFPQIEEAMAKLRPRSCIIDGEAIVLGDDGLPSFDRLRYRRRDASVILVAFDLIEFNGDDLRRTRSSSARRHWPSCCRARASASSSTSTSRKTAP